MLVLECERKGFVAELSSCPTFWFSPGTSNALVLIANTSVSIGQTSC